MLSKVHVNRGSLLKSIENLLKTIELSESAVMVPTLLRDKCEFDAWELLFVAKILKASILGHNDLVEFYMTHMSHSAVAAAHQQQQHLQNGSIPNTPTSGTNSINGFMNGDISSSPINSPGGNGNLRRLATSPSLSVASSLSSVSTSGDGNGHCTSNSNGNINGRVNLAAGQMQQQQQQQPQQHVTVAAGANSSSGSKSHSSAASWVTANQTAPSLSAGSAGSSFSNSLNGFQLNESQSSSSSTSSGGNGVSMLANPQTGCVPDGSNHNHESNKSTPSSVVSTNTIEPQTQPLLNQQQLQQQPSLPRHQESSDTSALLAARPLLMRQAQPPSLLQLTTTNNHINSVVAGFTDKNLENLTNQLTSLAFTNGGTNGSLNSNHMLNNSSSLDSTLSISTTVANQALSPSSTIASTVATTAVAGSANGVNQLNGADSGNISIATTTPTPTNTTCVNGVQSYSNHHRHNHHHAELKTSRSAGCLFRVNSSGASSPRTPLAQTPTTPYPQAETLANNQSLANGLLAADPGAPVKLLLQIEQLKSSINHVTKLLESVVELYKKSIDNIA